ncbi:unnamed protein product [Timema podura]|uniref:Cyclic nucleotide-binding domain-containing protein n=1 Tax=Timema podura TaxID=61482 RepID=A0ABN7NFC6_TIMPD|nr:unnamed protein product [Timema podura]
MIGIMVSAEKTSVNAEVERFLHDLWEILSYIANTLLFLGAGIIIVENAIGIIPPSDFVLVFITYIICNLTRFIMFSILSPILSRVEYGLKCNDAVIAVWGGLREFAYEMYVSKVSATTAIKGSPWKSQVVASDLCEHSCDDKEYFMDKIQIPNSKVRREISLAKKANMTNAVRHLANIRDRSIAMLKMDKFLADANWVLVEEATKIKHPFKIEYENEDDDEEEEEDDMYMGYRFTTCPDCQKDVLTEPTAREFKEMTKEARARVLKAKKVVSYWRQFEHGMLSKEGVRVLVTAVDVAADKEEQVVDLEVLKNNWKAKGSLVFVRSKLIDMMSSTGQTYYRVPRQRWRHGCYAIAMHRCFDAFIYFAIILNSIPIILEIQVNPPSGTSLNITLKVLNNIFFLIYFMEFVIKVVALGFTTYIKSHWNKLDFFILLISCADLVMDYLDMFTTFNKATNFTSTITTAGKLLRILRLARLFRLFRASIPKIIAFIDTRIDLQLSQGYDTGKGFVTGEEEISKILVHIVDNKRILDEMKLKVEANRLTVTKELGLMQRDRPWIAITVKTRQAIRSILNNLKDSVLELKDGGMLIAFMYSVILQLTFDIEGLLDAVEYPKLIEVVEDRLKYLRTHIKMVEPCPPQILLKEVPWVVGDEAVAEFLLENAETTSFNYGDTIVSHGEIPDGIFIIVSGLVKLLYTPNEKTLENLQRYGALPNMDFFTSLRFDEKQEDYIVSGNVIGELGVLTGRPYDITMTCDSSVQSVSLSLHELQVMNRFIPNWNLHGQYRRHCLKTRNAYKVSLEAIKDAMNLSSDVSQGLRARMWKAIAIRLAPVILMDVPTYQDYHVRQSMGYDIRRHNSGSWTQDKIKYHLERAFVPTLTQHRRFKVNELMEDLLLIEGQVKDYSNGMVYSAPTYIPRTVHQLMFPENNNMNNELSVETKLLIIPAKDVDELDIMENEENAMIISTSSSKCLQHLVQSRISSNASKLRKLRARNRKKNMFGFNAARPRYDAEGRKSIKPSMVSSSIFQTSNRVAPSDASLIFDSKEDSNKETVFTVKPDLGTSQDKREKEEFKRQRSDLFKVKENDDDEENQKLPERKLSIKEEPEVPTIPPRGGQENRPNLKIEKMPVSRPYILPPRVKMDDLTEEEEEDSDG